MMRHVTREWELMPCHPHPPGEGPSVEVEMEGGEEYDEYLDDLEGECLTRP